MSKKFLVAIAMLFVASAFVSARPTGLNLGGGISTSFFHTSGEREDVGYLGAYAEVGYDFKLAKNSYIYTGLRYLEAFNASEEVSVAVLRRTGDIQVPIFYQQNFPVGKKKTKLYLEAGPTFDFWAVWMENCFPKTGSMVTVNLFNEVNPNRFNVYVGGNFGIKIQNHVKIYLGGDYGLVNVLRNVGQVNRWQLHVGAAYVF